MSISPDSHAIHHFVDRLNEDWARLKSVEARLDEIDDESLKDRVKLLRENIESIQHLVESNEEKYRILREAHIKEHDMADFFAQNQHIQTFYAEFIAHIMESFCENQEEMEKLLHEEYLKLQARESRAVLLLRNVEKSLMALLLILEKKYHFTLQLQDRLKQSPLSNPFVAQHKPSAVFKPVGGDGECSDD